MAAGWFIVTLFSLLAALPISPAMALGERPDIGDTFVLVAGEGTGSRGCYFGKCPDDGQPDESAMFEISGRYYGTSSDSTGRQVNLVLDIQSEGSEGTLSGTLGERTLAQNMHMVVEGRVRGDTVIFEAGYPTVNWTLSFEGEFTGDSIRGRIRVVDPSTGNARPWEEIEFGAVAAPAPRPRLQPAYPESRQEMGAKMCCMDSTGWCESWSSRPGRLYAYEDLTYAELGSVCYCAGSDDLGQVEFCPR